MTRKQNKAVEPVNLWALTADNTVLQGQIAAWIKLHDNYHAAMHAVACGAVIQVLVHGNVKPLAAVANVLYKSAVGVASLKPWAEEFAPVTLSFNKESKLVEVKYKTGAPRITAEEALVKMHAAPAFFVHTKPTDPFKKYDLMARFKALQEEANRMLEAKHTGKLKRKGREEELNDAQRAAITISAADYRVIFGIDMPASVN